MPGQCPDCGRRNCDECQPLVEDDFLMQQQADEGEEQSLNYDYWREQEDNQDTVYEDWYDVEYEEFDEQDFGDDPQLVDLEPGREEELPF